MPRLTRLPLLALYITSQILLFMGLFQLYKSVRKVSIPEPKYAFENARLVLDIQGALRLNFELDLQRWILDQPHIVILAFNRIYAHYMIGFYILSMLCLLLAPERYRYIRRAFFISMVVALPWFYLFPLAPPRFLGEPHAPGFEDLTRYNFLDTLVAYGPIYFSSDGVVAANRYAAMPSMHCGWSLIGGLFIAAALPWKWVGRGLAVFIALLMGVTVMVTGNHYWLDVIGGWVIVAIALWINKVLPYPLPIRWPWQTRQTRVEPVATT
jgi:membrane-associated phospholipid phosphatase